MIKRGVPVVTIKAKDNYEFGYKLGKALKENIQSRIKKNKEVYKKRAYKPNDFLTLIKKAKKFIPVVKKYFPHLFIEAKAMAEGAEVPFEELFVLICDEEIVNFKVLRCTSVVFRTTDNSILLGHNEDWIPEYRNNGLFLVKGKIKNNRFLALGYVGNLVGSACGINANKIAYSDNSLDTDKFVYGIPRSFHLRALLDSKNPKEALKILNKKGNIISNTLFVSSNKIIVDVEEHWENHEVFSSEECFVHTNHTLNKKYWTKAQAEDNSSFKRYNRALELVSNKEKLDLDYLKKILRDHKGNICDHFDTKHPLESAPTIASIIMNPYKKWMMLCHGNPCKGKYKKYSL